MRTVVDRQGLTSIVAPPLEAPVRVRFRDTTTGQWLHGLSEPKIDPNHFRIHLLVQGYAPCRWFGHPFHPYRGTLARLLRRVPPPDAAHCPICGLPRQLMAERDGPANLCTNVFGKFVQAAILGTTETITDTGAAGRSVTKTVDGGVVPASTLICAGTGGSAATVADTNMQTQTESIANPTVNAISGSGATGTFTVTGTITATADRAYTEVGIKVTTTTTAWVFLICHDTFSALNVSNGGTLATTYTFSNS
jgi:hypothetical protein